METTVLQTTAWAIDPAHSEVQFKIKHLLISTVTGSFNSFRGQVTTENDDFEDAEIEFTIDVDSIHTNQEMRDNHLRSGDFFEASVYPNIHFRSTSFKKLQGNEFLLMGELTMKGVTREVELNAEFGGLARDQRGQEKAGFEVTGTVNRKEFGLTYNSITETGGLALGEDIKLNANIQLVKQLGSES